MKILALPLVLAMSLSIASAISEDGPTAIGATSASGMWKVDLKAGQSVGFSLLKKDDKGEYREIAKGNVDGLDGCHHWMAYVSDEGRFAVVNVATSEKDKVIALFSNSGQRKATLAISDVLSKEEMSSLPVRSRCPGHQDWNNGITINDESLVVETLAGRKVTVNLADGKIVKEEAKKEGPDASIIQDGTCPGGHVHDEFIGQCLSCKKERAGCGVGVPGIAPVRPRICRACADALGICQLCLKKK